MARVRKVLAAVLAGLALTLVSAAPAGAQADRLKLAVAGDGAEGVTIQATYADGRRLDREVRLVLTATGPDGQKVGPVQLAPAPEGQGFYTSGSLLSAGSWRVKVNAPAPHQGEATATVQAKAQAQAPRRSPSPSPSPTADRDGWWWPVAAAGLALLAAAMGAGMLLGRRRSSD
ncbi:hypothetical protein V6V47_21355 [Micromonospora sp. CPCC 205539]